MLAVPLMPSPSPWLLLLLLLRLLSMMQRFQQQVRLKPRVRSQVECGVASYKMMIQDELDTPATMSAAIYLVHEALARISENCKALFTRNEIGSECLLVDSINGGYIQVKTTYLY